MRIWSQLRSMVLSLCIGAVGLEVQVPGQVPQAGIRFEEEIEFQEVWKVQRGEAIELQFDGLRPHDFVAIGPGAGDEARILCAVGDPGRLPVPIRKPEPNELLVSRTAQGVSVQYPESSAPVFLYLRVPEGATVSVRSGSDLVYSAEIRSGMIWSDGGWSLQERPLNGARAMGLFLQGLQRSSVRSSPAGGEPYTVPFGRLQRERYVEPPFFQGEGPVKETLLIEIRADREGHVEAVRLLRGSEVAFEEARSYLAAWKFKHFRVQGKPVSFRTLVLLPIRSESFEVESDN